MARTDDPNHRKLQEDVTRFLEDSNYLVGEVTYHNAMPREHVERLQNIDTMTAQHVRTRSDCCAIHKEANLCFQFEIKTGGAGNRARVEALPLANHILVGVECLYVYRDTASLFEAGFFVATMPRVDEICIPNRWNAYRNREFESLFRKCWPHLKPKYVRHLPGGSGDPFAVIRYSDFDAAQYNWESLVTEFAMRNRGSI